jgi:hypothetical protein
MMYAVEIASRDITYVPSSMIEMGSGTMIYIPSFIKFGSGIHKLVARIHIQTHSKVIS